MASAMKGWLPERMEPSWNLWQVHSLVRCRRSWRACWARPRAACWERSWRRTEFSFSRSLSLALSSCSFLLNVLDGFAVLMASFGLLLVSVVGSFIDSFEMVLLCLRSRLIFCASSATPQSSKKLSLTLGTGVAAPALLMGVGGMTSTSLKPGQVSARRQHCQYQWWQSWCILVTSGLWVGESSPTMVSLKIAPSCPGLGISAPEQEGGKAPFKTAWRTSNQTNLPSMASR